MAYSAGIDDRLSDLVWEFNDAAESACIERA
jgi:hypothetical protein